MKPEQKWDGELSRTTSFTGFTPEVREEDEKVQLVQTVDIQLLPTNFRKQTLLPLPFGICGAALLTVSLFQDPWLEYTILAEGDRHNSIYRQHVRTGLVEQCRTMKYEGNFQCDTHGPSYITHMWAITISLCINAFIAWFAVFIAIYESWRTWLNETGDESVKNVPGVMLFMFMAAVLLYLVVFQTVITLYWFQSVDGGSASVAFFICEVGVVALTVAALLACRVSLQPTKELPPWQVYSNELMYQADSIVLPMNEESD